MFGQIIKIPPEGRFFCIEIIIYGKKKLTGAQAIMESLLQEGVEVLFGYPGGQIMPTYDALWYKPGLGFLIT